MAFTAGVYYGGGVRMNNYNLRLWLTTNCTDSTSQNVAFERIKYFVFSDLDSTVFINCAETERCDKLVDAGLNITTLPGDPVDQIIGIMLYYKLNAIMEDRMIVTEIEISSDLGEGMVYLHGENENTDLVNKSDWWHDSDLIHCDYNVIAADKVVSLRTDSSWRDLDLAWPLSNKPEQSDPTIVFAEFGKNETK
jgi:hypothetical protein